MKSISIYVTFLFLFVSGALCMIDLELYNKIKENAPFELLEYHQIREIFKDVQRSDPAESLRKRKELEEQIKAKLQEVKDSEDNYPFLAFTQQKINLPSEHDWRKLKPECFSPPKHQMNCGSCYIFAPIAAFESRLCLLSGGRMKPELSQQDVLSCAPKHNKCGGGLLTDVWEYLENNGTSSYHCKPYVSYSGSVPFCSYKCDNPGFYYDKWMAVKGSMNIFSNNFQQMKEQIYSWGPINAFMDTFEDLSAYKSGLYFHTVGKQTDPHAITIVGWGYDTTHKSDYWIIRNSWGPDWGENGYLKVLAGLYNIGSFVATSLPYV